MSLLPPVFVELKANVSEFTTAMGEARGEVAKLETEGTGSFDKLATFGKAALLGIGTAAISVGGLSLEMADKFETSHAKLETALKNAGASFEQFATPIDDAQKKMEQFGYTNAQTQEALANLTTATKDPQKALNDLGLAADLAKYKHIDLADAATAVARASEGQTKALKQLGIDLPVTAGGAAKLEAANNALSKATDAASAYLKAHSDALDANSKSHATYEALLGKVHDAQEKVNSVASAGTEIMKGLSDAIGGQAAKQAETFSGQMAAVKAQSEDVAKNIGVMLIPIIEKLIGVVKDIVDWFGKHKAIAEAFAAVIGGVLVTAIGAYIATLGKAALASVSSFGEMIAGWVGFGEAATVAGAEVTAAGAEVDVATGGISVAIGLIVTAIIYLATHWKQIWNDVKTIIADAWDWISSKIELIWHLFTEASPLGIAIKWLGDHWSQIWGGIKDVVSGAWNFIEGIIGRIVDGVKGFVGLLKSAINDIISIANVVIRTIDSIHVKIPSWVPLIGGNEFGINLPEIPMLANGGIVNSPTLAMIGEAGPEAVIPLSQMGGMGSGMNITINVAGSVVQEKDLAVTVRDNIAQLMRRRGLNPSILGV